MIGNTVLCKEIDEEQTVILNCLPVSSSIYTAHNRKCFVIWVACAYSRESPGVRRPEWPTVDSPPRRYASCALILNAFRPAEFKCTRPIQSHATNQICTPRRVGESVFENCQSGCRVTRLKGQCTCDCEHRNSSHKYSHTDCFPFHQNCSSFLYQLTSSAVSRSQPSPAVADGSPYGQEGIGGTPAERPSHGESCSKFTQT